MSKRTATLLASVNVPRTYCRYSQQLHLQPRPCCLNSASTSNDSLLAAASVTTFAGSWSRPGQHLGLKNGGRSRRRIGGRPPGDGPPSFGSRPRQLVGENICDSWKIFWSPRRVTFSSVGAFTPWAKVYSARACSTRMARTGRGPGAGLAIGSKLPSTGLGSSTTRSSRFTTCGRGVRDIPTSIASETLWIPGTCSTVGVTTSPERRCGRSVGMALPLWRGGGPLRNLSGPDRQVEGRVQGRAVGPEAAPDRVRRRQPGRAVNEVPLARRGGGAAGAGAPRRGGPARPRVDALRGRPTPPVGGEPRGLERGTPGAEVRRHGHVARPARVAGGRPVGLGRRALPLASPGADRVEHLVARALGRPCASRGAGRAALRRGHDVRAALDAAARAEVGAHGACGDVEDRGYVGRS